MKHAFLFGAVALWVGAASAAVSGTVFWDSDGNGKRDAGEAPCVGAAVSDGLYVVRTDAEGRFTLPADHPKARFVSLSVPDGARVARHWIPVKAQGDGYDFALTPWAPAAKGAHTFIHISDTEMSGGEQPHYRAMAEGLRDLARQERAAFVIHTGDICYERGLREHQALFKDVGVPVFWAIGNHDLVKGPYGEALFESLYGPTWYSFNAGGTHYVVLPMPGGDHRPSYSTREVAAWLRNDLALLPPGTPLVVFCHDLLCTGERFDYGGVDLAAHGLKAWLYGHWHLNHARRQGAVQTFCTNAPEKGGIDSAVSAFRLMRIAADGTPRSDLRYAPLPKPSAQRAKTLWSVPVGGEVLFSSPIADGRGSLFLGVTDENLRDEGGVAAFDAATGKKLWHAHTRAAVKNAIATDGARVYAQDSEGWVYAFAADDGAKVWESKLPNAPLPGLVSGVTLADGTLYAGAGQSLTAFDPATGKKRWQGGGWRLREGTPDRPTLADGAIILGSHWDALCATDAATGKLLWRKADANFRFRGSVAAPDGKTVWVPARKSLFQLEARTGKVLRGKDLGLSLENGGQPLLTEKLILLTTVDAGLVALDRATLEERWRLPVGEGLVFAAPYSHSPMRPIQGSAVRAGDRVLVAASDGCLHAADLATGNPLWSKNLGAPLLGTPLVHEGKVYVADLLGTLHCLPLE